MQRLRRDTDAARQQYTGEGSKTVWRLLMPDTRHHVYYRRADGIAYVITVESAIAPDGPDL